jgi:tetratricopeptide (TPR) repeat protein
MKTAALAARLRQAESPAIWWSAAVGCRLARVVGLNQSRWSTRLGYALERLDEAREARREAPTGRLALLGRSGAAARQLRLARRLERGADWAGAARAYQAAVRLDGSRPAGWFRLGRCRERHGDLTGAVAALARAAELGGPDHPGWRVRLADLLDRLGEWDQARLALRHNAREHPRHAASHRRLGEVSLRLAYWGGSFTSPPAGSATSPPDGASPDPGAARSGGRFRFDPAAGSAAGAARRALERAAELEPARSGAGRVALAEARLADGDLPGAAELLAAALRDVEESTGRWVLAVKQRWQFQLESIHHRLGRPRVDDPLFACTVTPVGSLAGPDDPVVGVFDARTTFAGLAITGLVADPDADQVEIWLDGTRLRAVNLGGGEPLRQFKLELRRTTLASFPRRSELAVVTAGGQRLRVPGGAERLRLEVPHGDGRLPRIIAAGGTLDKKGAISPSAEQTHQRQQRYLEIYARAREFFENELGRSLFLMYGTLLGLHRDGDFIPGDDDFDAGYVSEQTDPIAVKEETKRIIIKLVQAGFTISFNRKGRLFRLQLEREATDGFHLDVRPLWFQDGRVWVHNHCSFPASRDDFVPAAGATLRGVPVSVPRDTELFLRGHYGPGWKVPDPGFMYYLSEIDPAVLDNLGKALITVQEYRELADRIRREVGEAPPAGRLVSVGSQDLYPLEQFLP